MAEYFAEIKDNIVQRVIVCESKEWCETKLGGEWVETFYDSNNKKYAGIGDVYNENKNNFSRPKPYPSWVQDEKTLEWLAPKAYPVTEIISSYLKPINWNEKEQNWERK